MNVGGPLPPGMSERRYEELLVNFANAPKHPETLAAMARAKARGVGAAALGSQVLGNPLDEILRGCFDSVRNALEAPKEYQESRRLEPATFVAGIAA